jgi:exopolysaccharide production protein ExoY
MKSKVEAGTLRSMRLDVPASISVNRLAVLERLRLCAGQLAALVLLLLAGPLMLLVAWAIRRDGGPATFEHYRVGCGGRLFPCLKFRTMREGAERALRELLERDEAARAEWSRDHKLARDPRVTRLGRWLRASSLDELPQLLNVLRGEMALVGPRPITVPELRRYGGARWGYLSVVPGMTGLWQVSGRSEIPFDEMCLLDIYYIENWSIRLDAQILMMTIPRVLTRHGAY